MAERTFFANPQIKVWAKDIDALSEDEQEHAADLIAEAIEETYDKIKASLGDGDWEFDRETA